MKHDDYIVKLVSDRLRVEKLQKAKKKKHGKSKSGNLLFIAKNSY